MIINRLVAKSKQKKTVNLNDLAEITEKYSNVKLTSEKILPTYSVKKIAKISSGEKIVNVKNIHGIPHLVIGDGTVLKYTGEGFLEQFKASNEEVELEEISYQGVRGLLVLSKTDGAKILSVGEEITADINYSKVHLSYGNVLFIGIEDRLHFASFNTLGCMPPENFIVFPSDAGKVIGLLSNNKKLLVFCEHAIFSLTFFGSVLDYKVDRLFDVSSGIDGDSVAMVDGNLIFTSNRELIVSKNSTLNRISVATNLNDFDVSGKACSFDGKYLLPLKRKNDGKECLFVYNPFTGEEEMLYDCKFIVGGGYTVIDDGEISLAKLVKENDDKVGKWQSSLLDFSTKNKKFFNQIAFYSDGEGELVVIGEYCEKRFLFGSGVNVKRLNFTSRVLKIELIGKGLSIKDIEMIYRTKGD